MYTQEEIAEWPEWMDLKQTPPKDAIGLLIRWLGSPNQRKNHLAVSGLVHLGQLVLPKLVLVAARQPAKVLPVLDVIEQIGQPLDPNSFFTLMFTLNKGNPAVCRRIAEVLSKLRETAPHPQDFQAASP